MPEIPSQTELLLPLLTVAAGVPFLYLLWRSIGRPNATTNNPHNDTASIPPTSAIGTALSMNLLNRVFFYQDPGYASSLGSYWSKQQQEMTPECVVQPRNEKEVSIAVKILKEEFDRSSVVAAEKPFIFAVRSGGHSTIPGASNANRGVVIDLSLLKQIEPAEDRCSVVVGSGARWGEVSRKLDGLGIAVAGGRNSDVGVGGLTLGGGYSYFSPKVGFVCDNVIEYRIVLASGKITTASKHQNHQLWRALKGGGNNFGIVVQFKLRAFPCTSVWSGFLYMFSWKAPQLLQAFHETVKGPHDESAGGLLVCISYVQQIGMTLIATHLMYTKPEPWPACWQGLKKIGRIWNSTKVQMLTSTTDELDRISPAGFRQLHISTTIKNDLETLKFAHLTFSEKAKLFRKVKGMVWTLVLQPLHTSTMRSGKDNVLGLADRPHNLVIVLFTAVWERQSDDDLVQGSGRAAIQEINNHAVARGTADHFRYLNWCDDTQQPLKSYGEENLQFLRNTRKHVDPDGFFQRGCVGGHKLL